MAKRKVRSDSEDEHEPRKRWKNSLNQSTSELLSKVKTESNSETDNETKSKSTPKENKRKKHISPNTSDGDSDRQSRIALLLNETKQHILSTNKSSKTKKVQKQKVSNRVSAAFTPKTVYIEPSNVSINEVELGDKSTNQSNETDLVNNGKENNSIADYIDDNDETKMMEAIEEKVHVLQNIQVSPKKTKSPQELLNILYPNLKLVPIQTKLKIKSSNDVFLLRIPKSVEPDSLLNTNIDLEELCKVKIGSEKFVFRPTSKMPDPTFVLSSNSKIVEFKRNIVMEKYVKANKRPNIPTAENFLVPFPDDLKKRHPLFGSNFGEKIHLSADVEKRIDEAISNLLKVKNKTSKKQKTSRANSTLLPDTTSNDFSPNVSSISTKKRIKKEKPETETNESEIFQNVSTFDSFNIEDFIPTTKKRKIKKEPTSPELEMNNYFEESVDPESPKKAKKRKVKEEPIEFSPPKKKKKNKKEYE